MGALQDKPGGRFRDRAAAGWGCVGEQPIRELGAAGGVVNHPAAALEINGLNPAS